MEELYHLKICFLAGSKCVDKIGVIRSMVSGFSGEPNASIVQVRKFVTTFGRTVDVSAWDVGTWSQTDEEHNQAICLYLRDTDAVVLVYETSLRESFDALKEADLLKKIREFSSPNVKIMLIGNHSLDDTYAVLPKEGVEFAKQNGILFTEVCARTGEGIDDALNTITCSVAEEGHRQGIVGSELEPTTGNTRLSLSRWISRIGERIRARLQNTEAECDSGILERIENQLSTTRTEIETLESKVRKMSDENEKLEKKCKLLQTAYTIRAQEIESSKQQIAALTATLERYQHICQIIKDA